MRNRTLGIWRASVVSEHASVSGIWTINVHFKFLTRFVLKVDAGDSHLRLDCLSIFILIRLQVDTLP